MPKVRKNKMKLSRKNLIKLILILAVILMLIIIVCNLLFSKKRTTYAGLNLNKKMDMNKITLVESKDGIQVPVPKGYTASSVESEMYVNGKYTEKKASIQELTFTSEGENAWTQREDGTWESGGKGVNYLETTMTSNEFTLTEYGKVSIDWAVSSESGCDYVYYTIEGTKTDGTSVSLGGDTSSAAKIGGYNYGDTYETLNWKKANVELQSGTYTITFTYRKDSSGNSGLDAGFVKKVEVLAPDENGTETITTKEYGGFVIYEGEEVVTESNINDAKKTRNQWVWIPIEDISTTEPQLGSYDKDNYALTTNLNGKTRYSLLGEMQKEFGEMIESVSTYKGYYIARYEMGNTSKNKLVTVSGNMDIAYIKWYGAYEKCKKLATNNDNVKTSLIWETQWDNTLKWIIDTKEKTAEEVRIDSTSWGNYYYSTFSYVNVSGQIATKKSKDSTKIPTGSTEYTKANNIYDLAGNIGEWTMDGYSSNSYYGRYYRGGFYTAMGGSIIQASCRADHYPYYSDSTIRLQGHTLYSLILSPYKSKINIS